LKFLVDENLGGGLVNRLRELGHDVLWVVEVMPGSSDDDVLKLAVAQQRVLITEDKDFGSLIYGRRLNHAGVLLLRLRRSLPLDVRNNVEAAIAAAGDRLQGRFAVLREGALRLR